MVASTPRIVSTSYVTLQEPGYTTEAFALPKSVLKSEILRGIEKARDTLIGAAEDGRLTDYRLAVGAVGNDSFGTFAARQEWVPYKGATVGEIVQRAAKMSREVRRKHGGAWFELERIVPFRPGSVMGQGNIEALPDGDDTVLFGIFKDIAFRHGYKQPRNEY